MSATATFAPAPAAVFSARDYAMAKIAAKTLAEVVQNIQGFQLTNTQSMVAQSALNTLQELMAAATKRAGGAAATTAATAAAAATADSDRYAPPSLHNLAMKCIAGDLHDYRNVIALSARALSERVAFGATAPGGGSASWFVFSAEKKRFVRMGADLAELHEALWQDVGSIFGEEYSYLISRAQSNVPGAAAMAAKAVMFQNKLSLDRTYRAAIIQAWEAAMRNRR